MHDERPETRQGPLSDLKVLDLGRLIAASFTAALLADWGADVVKIEHPTSPDPVRGLGPHRDGEPLWTKVIGRNKRFLGLDLKTDEGRNTFLDLVAEADVVVENFLPGTLERMGLGFADLSDHNPALIMLSISGYGQTGPRSGQRAFGRSAEDYGGLAYITGFSDRPPLHNGFPLADYVTGTLGAAAVLAAIHERADNPMGEGQYIDLALYEAVLRLLEVVPVAYDQLGIVTERSGAGNTYSAPSGTWLTKDGKWASFTASTEQMSQRLFHAMDRPDLGEDVRYSTNRARLEHASDLHAEIGEWIGSRTLAEVLERLEAFDVAVAPVNSIADIFADPHVAARQALVQLDDPDLGALRMQGVVPKFGRTPGSVRHTGRDVDADRHSVLRDWLGVDERAALGGRIA